MSSRDVFLAVFSIFSCGDGDGRQLREPSIIARSVDPSEAPPSASTTLTIGNKQRADGSSLHKDPQKNKPVTPESSEGLKSESWRTWEKSGRGQGKYLQPSCKSSNLFAVQSVMSREQGVERIAAIARLKRVASWNRWTVGCKASKRLRESESRRRVGGGRGWWAEPRKTECRWAILPDTRGSIDGDETT